MNQKKSLITESLFKKAEKVEQKMNQGNYGELTVEVKFPIGTSRETLMELLADALYKPDVSLFDPMPSEYHEWERIQSNNILFRYDCNSFDNEEGENSLTYEKLKSLFLHKAVLDELRKDWEKCSTIAYENIERWKENHRSDGMSVKYLDEWVELLDKGFTAVSQVLLGVDEHSCDLRQNSPFAGVLSDEKRLMVLQEFKEYWKQNFEKKVDE